MQPHSNMVDRVCEICKKEFSVHARYIKRGHGRFCSRGCTNKSRKVDVTKRFLDCVGEKQPNGCIHWTGSTLSDGRGTIWAGEERGSVLASRFSYEYHNGKFDESLCVLHTCDNPICVNPDHLFLGTKTDNAADRDFKNRQAKGEKAGPFKLTNENVIEIRKMYSNGLRGVDIAKKFNVSLSTVKLIVSRRTWKHI